MLLPSRVRLLLTGYPELIAVLAAAVLGLSVQPPLARLASHEGINILLAILAFATAVTIEPAELRSLTRTWPSLLAALAAGITVLPALSWAVAQIVAAGPLRNGIMTLGLAPCEIASIATTTMAVGEAALPPRRSSAPPRSPSPPPGPSSPSKQATPGPPRLARFEPASNAREHPRNA